MSTPVISTVTAYEDKALDLLVKVQDEVVGYVEQAVSLVDGRLPEVELPKVAVIDRLPSLAELVDTQFAFARKVLDAQERFATAVVDAIRPLAGDAAPKAKATKPTAKAA